MKWTKARWHAIYIHPAEAIGLGLIEPVAELLLLSAEHAEVVNALHAQSVDSEHRLKPVFDQLDGKYGYGVLKCVVAGLTRGG